MPHMKAFLRFHEGWGSSGSARATLRSFPTLSRPRKTAGANPVVNTAENKKADRIRTSGEALRENRLSNPIKSNFLSITAAKTTINCPLMDCKSKTPSPALIPRNTMRCMTEKSPKGAAERTSVNKPMPSAKAPAHESPCLTIR